MLLQSEYKFFEKISPNGKRNVYRAERQSDNEKVILQILEIPSSGSEEAVRFRNEFEIARNLSCKGISSYLALQSYNNHLVAVIKNFEGITLEKYLQIYNYNILNTLKIAISITDILEYFYEEGVVHQGLCPAHFLVNTNTLDVSLIDCSNISRVSTQSGIVEQPYYLESSLAYTSPEQTGRVKSEIDIRTDLYSLGIILYEMVTGNVPFEVKEPLALVHSHIAKIPLAPHLKNPKVPVLLSQIILKLLSKNAKDRYGSPFGLKADLQNCLDQLNTGKEIEIFELAQQDFSGRLRNSKNYYGRENETSVLLQAFNRVCEGAVETVFVEGYAGIGKSALVYKLKNSFQLKGGIFIRGKFNQFQRNIPYTGFIQAFKEFTDFILTQSIDIIDAWKEDVQKAVGLNGKVLTEVITHLELLIGPQPPIPELEPNEIQNRFHYVFLNLIRCISKTNHPLVLFFDDLQWLDAASSNLLKIITADKELNCFLLVGAYRNNEINENSFFSDVLGSMQKANCLVQKILLPSLSLENTRELISETLVNKVSDSQLLVNLVYTKSKGNPFFIISFLKSLYAGKVLFFDHRNFKWTWDIAKLNQLKFTDNIIELMTGRIQQLQVPTQEVLKLASCLGYEFDLQVLLIVLGQNESEISKNLKPALEEDLIIAVGDSYRFTHDRIQQAAYSLIPDDRKKEEHLKIGYLLLENIHGELLDKYVFEIVTQLNIGIESIILPELKHKLAALNLMAGIKAKSSVAYNPSFEYLQTGIHLLDMRAWKNQYELALEMYTEGAESAYLSGNIKMMEKWIDDVLQNASTVLDKVRVYETRIKFYIAQNKQYEAVQVSLEILALLNVRFPKKPTKVHVISALIQTRLTLYRKGIKPIINLPLIKKPYVEAAIRILVNVGSAVYFALPNLFPLMVCKGFSLMIKNGNSPYSGIVCTSYGIIILGGVGNIPSGYRWGKIAEQLSEKFDKSGYKCQSRMMVNTFIVHWKEHLRNTLQPLLQNYWYGLENGNIEFATYSALVYCYNSFFSGANLKELTEENNRFFERFQLLRHESALNMHGISAQAVLNLCTPVDNPNLLSGKFLDEEKMISFYKETSGENALFKIYLYKLILSFLFEKYEDAEKNAREAGNRINSASGSPDVPIFYFYETLTILSRLRGDFRNNQKKMVQKIYKNFKLFRKFASLSPMNSLHKLLLIEAEICRVTGDAGKAILLYDKAISKAKENAYINDLALAYELASNFYKSIQRESISREYLMESYKHYQKWSAFTKVRDMERKHPDLNEEQPVEISSGNMNRYHQNHNFTDTNTSKEKVSYVLDLQSILNASAAISSEIEVDKLLKILIKICVENAGAQHGYLVLKKETDFFIEAEGSIDLEEEVIIQSIPLKGNNAISEAIIQFVYVTQENLVIENGMEDPNFSADPIIVEKASKSILCHPIIQQGKVIGILYLENNLITNAFIPERIEVLKLLSGQVAISLQNALNEEKKMNAFVEREKLLQKVNLHEQELLKTKLEIQEQTFHNISQEIHDNIGQVLTLIKLNIHTIGNHVPEALHEKVAESKNLLSVVIRELRDLSKTLSSDFINEEGLGNAIKKQINLLERTGLYVTELEVKGTVFKLPSQHELIVFRIVQELLNNIMKHAEATSIHIEMNYEEEKLIINVNDNGKGFDFIQASSSESLGLRNMQNRILLLNGSISFSNNLGQGTMVQLELPR